jgi:hypothetical protein
MKFLLKPALIFLFAILGFTGCVMEGPRGPQGPSGPAGPPGADGWAYYDVQYYNISRWSLAANGKYFYSEVSAPAITTNVFDKGVIVGYLVYDWNKPTEVHIPLPFDIYHNEYNDFGILESWTETVSFDVMPGRVTFYFEPSDFYTGDIPPTYMFKVVSMW